MRLRRDEPELRAAPTVATSRRRGGSGNKTVDFDVRQTTIRCAGFCPAEVAKVQPRANAGRNRDWKLQTPRFIQGKVNSRKRRKHHGIETDA
jgi:hypothetical protein